MEKLGGEFRSGKLLESFYKISKQANLNSQEEKVLGQRSFEREDEHVKFVTEDLRFHPGTRNLGLDSEISQRASSNGIIRTERHGKNSHFIYEHSVSDPELNKLEKDLDSFIKNHGLISKPMIKRVSQNLVDPNQYNRLKLESHYRMQGNDLDSIA